MYERFTDRARKVMQIGQPGSPAVQPRVHWHRAHPAGLGQRRQRRRRQRPEESGCRSAEDPTRGREAGPERPEMVTMGKLPQTPRAKKVIEYSMEEARNLNHNYVGTEHILLGLLARTGGRRRPGADEPGPEAGRRPRGSAEPAGHGLEGRRRRARAARGRR
jgi:ATP-dependent Clp protease ATP-binding subunit ClpC